MRGHDQVTGNWAEELLQTDKFTDFYAFYGMSPHHPPNFVFRDSSLAGSYFLGRCRVDRAVVYKSDVRGDELKSQGQVVRHRHMDIPVASDEAIHIQESYLAKALVHSHSHDPEHPERFEIQKTIALPYSNIHGSPLLGCLLGSFATVDLTVARNCVFGPFSYIQTGELFRETIPAGCVYIQDSDFMFRYQFDTVALGRYVGLDFTRHPRGEMADFLRHKEPDFAPRFDAPPLCPFNPPHPGSAVSHYAVLKGQVHVDQNVLVTHRAYLENSWLGPGSNAQENCCIVESRLAGRNVNAHGAKLVQTRLGQGAFVGFNAFLKGRPEAPIDVGENSIILPHTIIDADEAIAIPANRLAWGLIRRQSDLAEHSLDMEDLNHMRGELQTGRLRLRGDGASFVNRLRGRVDNILKSNGAYFDGSDHHGHAQRGQDISYNIIQPHAWGEREGLFPTMRILP